MRIVKHGEIPEVCRRFTCKACGTVFDAGLLECWVSHKPKGEAGADIYQSVCPLCGAYVIGNEVVPNLESKSEAGIALTPLKEHISVRKRIIKWLSGE